MVYIENKLKERNTDQNKNRLIIAIGLNILIVIIQVIFGLYSNSISLITDAIHNFQDVISLIVSLIAILALSKKPTLEMTFGFLKAESMAGFVNSLILMITLIFIIYEATLRLIHPEEVKGLFVIIFGFIAFIVNLISALILKHHHHHEEDDHHHHEDINIAAAYIHLLSDALLSLSVVIGGIFIYLFQISIIDSILSLIFSVYIFKETFPILKKSYKVLMEAAPSNINLYELIDEMKNRFDEIVEIHDIHVWSLSSKDIYFTGHIVVKDMDKSMEVLENLEKFLKEKGITHSTIQIESTDKICEIFH